MALTSGALSSPSYRHPNMGLAPVDMTAGFTAAAALIRRGAADIAASGLEMAVQADPSLRSRHDDLELRRLLRDGELLVERLSMCVASDRDRWITDYAEWIGPIQRRRGMPLSDLASLCLGIRDRLRTELAPAEFEAAAPSASSRR